jgi:hypothetical protein
MTLLEQIKQQLRTLPPEKQSEVLDFIVFLRARSQASSVAAASDKERGKRIKASFQQLAKMKAFSGIHDPVQWQREIRRDRSLPGRAK